MTPGTAPDIPAATIPTQAAGDDPVWLHAISRLSTALNRAAAVISAGLLVLMTGLILLEVVLRFFSHSTYMADVLVAYGVAAITFLAAPWALEAGSMIRVKVLTDRMSALPRRIAEAFTLLSAGAILWLLLAYQWKTVLKLWARGSLSQHFIQIPLWIPECFFLAGLALLLFQIVVRGLRLIAVGHSEERAVTL